MYMFHCKYNTTYLLTYVATLADSYIRTSHANPYSEIVIRHAIVPSGQL